MASIGLAELVVLVVGAIAVHTLGTEGAAPRTPSLPRTLPSAGYERRCTMHGVLHSAITLATLALAGCVTHVAVPDDDDEWTESSSGTHVWSAADVSVVARAASADRMSGRIESSSAAPQRFRFTTTSLDRYPSIHWFGEASGGPPTYAEPWSRRIEMGTWWELPAGSDAAPATLDFQLAPSYSDASSFAYRITFSSPSGTSTCPFAFQVHEEERLWWTVTKVIGTVLGYVLIAALFVVLAIGAAMGSGDFGDCSW